MLKLRQMIPPVTMRALHATPQTAGAPLSAGRTVRAWDYKHQRALVIAYLHHDCERCRAWMEPLRRAALALAEREAVALLVFAHAPDARLCEGVPANIVMGVDVNGRSIRAFLGHAALDRSGQNATGVFVADRYGELFAQWGGESDAALPPMKDVLSWLAQIQITCEECCSPHWPTD
jgi:hypothetical protein